jgi:hypothetical protein
MSESNNAPEPRKDGGLKQPPQPKPSEEGLNKIDGGRDRTARSADDIEREDSPGGRDGGMIGEG